MKQYSLFTDKPEEFIALVDSIRGEPFYKNASDRLLLMCENRARFLGELTAADMQSYTAFSPQAAWVRAHAGIMLDKKGGVINSAILSIGLREGSSRGARDTRTTVLPETRRQGAIPLNERLARFLEQTTNELGDMAVEADAANSAKSAFLSNMSHEIRTPHQRHSRHE